MADRQGVGRGYLRDPNLTASYVRSLLSYNPDSGEMRWRKDRHGTAKAGDLAGHISLGYRVIKMVGRSIKAHRVAWLIQTGEWPPGQVDHRDCDGTNNRWSNLRLASPGENARNRRAHCDNPTSLKGVYRCKDGRYSASITKNYVQYNLGRFDTAEDAHAAYAAAAVELHGEFARAA